MHMLHGWMSSCNVITSHGMLCGVCGVKDQCDIMTCECGKQIRVENVWCKYGISMYRIVSL